MKTEKREWTVEHEKPVVVDEHESWSVKGPESDWMFLRHESDAHLIAAAPDLLQACQRLLKHLESVEDTHKGSDDDEIFARAAIAKATNNAEKTKKKGK